MTIVDTELFGPVLSVLRFDDENEVHWPMTANSGWPPTCYPGGARAMRMTKRCGPALSGSTPIASSRRSPEFGGYKIGLWAESGMQAIYDYARPRPPGSTPRMSRWPTLSSCADAHDHSVDGGDGVGADKQWIDLDKRQRRIIRQRHRPAG